MERDDVVLVESEKAFLPVLQSEVQNKIVSLRGCDVISDADVAELYGV